jgi:hypothetical protein
MKVEIASSWEIFGILRRISEKLDVVTEWLVLAITYPFEVVLIARLFTSSYKIINECLA